MANNLEDAAKLETALKLIVRAVSLLESMSVDNDSAPDPQRGLTTDAPVTGQECPVCNGRGRLQEGDKVASDGKQINYTGHS